MMPHKIMFQTIYSLHLPVHFFISHQSIVRASWGVSSAVGDGQICSGSAGPHKNTYCINSLVTHHRGYLKFGPCHGHIEVLTKGVTLICGIFWLLCPLIYNFSPWWLTATTSFTINIDSMAQKTVTSDKFLPSSWPSRQGDETNILSDILRSRRGVNLIKTLQYFSFWLNHWSYHWIQVRIKFCYLPSILLW